jgi:hypothetical protein
MHPASRYSYYYSSVGVTPEYQAYIDYLTANAITTPSAAVQTATNALIAGLKTDGLWDDFVQFNLLAFGSLQTATVNLSDPDSLRFTEVGTSPVFTEGQGSKSAGAGSCFNTQGAVNEYVGIESDFTVIIDVNESGTPSSTDRIFGSNITANTAQRLQLNSNTRFTYGTTVAFANPTDCRGVYILTHTGANSVIYKDVVKFSSANTPIEPTLSNKILLLAYNTSTTSGVTVGTNPFTKNVMLYARASRRFTDAKVLLFTNRYETFKQAVITNVNDWFVRAAGGAYGTETGVDFDNAFDGDVDVNWLGILPGDTLYACDTLNETLTVEVSRITIDGAYPSHPCTIDGDDTRTRCIFVNGLSYVTIKNITAIDATTDCISFFGPGYGNVCNDCTVSGSGNQGFQNEGSGEKIYVTYNRVIGYDNVDDGMSLHAGAIVTVNTAEFYNNGQGVHAIGDAIGVFNDVTIHDNSLNNIRAEGTVDFTFNRGIFYNGTIVNVSSVPIKLNDCDLGNCTLTGTFIIDGVEQTF